MLTRQIVDRHITNAFPALRISSKPPLTMQPRSPHRSEGGLAQTVHPLYSSVETAESTQPHLSHDSGNSTELEVIVPKDLLVRRRRGCDAFACFAEMVGGGPAVHLDSQPRRSFVVRSDGLHDIASMVGMVLNHF